MTARQKFRLGQRAVLSTEGRSSGLYSDDRTSGQVVGFSRISDVMVRVRRYGYRTPYSDHMDFWEPADKGPS